MKVEVKQKHIDNGRACDSNDCPIALAIKEQTNLPVEVGNFGIHINGTYYVMPEEAQEFIICFDNLMYTDIEVHPFTFELTKVEK